MFYSKWLKKEIKYFFLDHKTTRFVLSYGYMLVLCLLSALSFAVGFRSFISLNQSLYSPDSGLILNLATGGMSGLAQCIIMVFEIFKVQIDYNLLQSIFYFILNLPLLILSFAKLGFKFSIFTTLNVVFVSLFINFLPASTFDEIAKLIADQPLSRAIFAGICTGLSSALAFKSGHSTGGADVIAYYFSSRKSTNAGKYIGLINGIIIISFTILSIINSGVNTNAIDYAQPIIIACFSIVYLFVATLVVDGINVRNKKVLLNIITSNEALSRIIVANVPHSCTVIKGKGGYTNSEKFFIYTVVSNSEVTHLVNKIRHVDENSFITTTNLRQVYGRFFIKPTE